MTGNIIPKQTSALIGIIEDRYNHGEPLCERIKKVRYQTMAKMRSKKVTEAQRAATDRYDAKTYKKISFALRVQDDEDIIKDIKAAQDEGASLRSWLRNLFDNAKK